MPVNSVLMESARRDIATLDRCGGDLALDFANTLGGLREGPWDDEWLHSYADVWAWARHAGVVAAQAPPAGRAAAAAFRRAIALRERVYAVMAALAHGDDPPAADLAGLQAAHGAALARARLVRRGAALEWDLDDGVDLPLDAVALAAVELLRSAERLGRLRQCRNCRWLFLDTSRNASRRWCSMAHCGTGAKVAATRARRRAARR
jgi:predicted RNA-binding Zn ribbon-like protein